MEQAKRLLALVLAVLLLLPPVYTPAAASEVEAAEQESTVQEATEPETNPAEQETAEQETAKPPKKTLAVKSATADTATAIAVDQTLTAEVPEGGCAWFSFTPAEDGYYVFTSNADVDTYVDLYDEDQNHLAENDDGGNNNNFSLTFAAVAGKTYYLGARTYGGGAATYEVTLSQSAVASITVEPLKLIEGTCGYMSDGYNPDTDSWDLTFFRYYWWDYVSYTVTMKNGDTISGSGTGFTYNGQGYALNWSDEQGSGEIWTVGNSYTADVNLAGATAQVEVTITESPVESVTVSPLSFVENTSGYWSDYYDEDTGSQQRYYRYYWWDYVTYTVTFKDGTSNTCRGMGFEYEGQWYEAAWSDVQDSYNRWTVGNTYEIAISVMGVFAPVSVTITDTPIASIAVDPIVMQEGTNGDWRVYQTEDTEVEYYHYYWWNQLSYTVTFTDGSTQTGNEMRFDYNGQEYGITISEEQNGLAPWTGGNTYTPTITLIGVTAQVRVTIEESPIASITAASIAIPEGTCGSWHTYHADDTETKYYRYYWWERLSYTVTFTDGSTYSGNGTYFYYNGQDYHIDCFDEQSGLAPWTAGNTYTPTVSVAGVSAQVSVTIEESPIASITVDPVSMMENAGGEYRYEYDPETDSEGQYFMYCWWWYLNYTVTLKDGSSFTGSGSGFNYNGQWYSFEWDDDQSVSQPWAVNNTYTPTIYVAGVSAPVSVTIEESPVVSITVEPVTVCENMDGDWCSEYNPDTGMETRYFRYNWAYKMAYTVTLNDGSTVSGSGTGFSYNGQYYNINYSDNQSASNPWTVGNTYTQTVTLMGVDAQVSITVDSSPVASITVQPIAIMENTNGYWSEDYNPQTGTYESYYRYSWYNNLRYTVTMKDGSTATGYGTNIYYNGQWYYVSSTDDQYVANPWQAGNTYYPTITLMGMTVQVPVTIEESPIVSIAVDPITLTDGLGGGWENGYNSETGNYDRMYYRFYWHWRVSYTVTLRDGSTIRCTDGSSLYYDDQWFGLSTNDEQSFDNIWTAGNTYTGTVRIAGITTTVDITIAESPVESVSFEPIEIPEGAGGYWVTSYDSETQSEKPLYFLYQWWEKLSYTVTFRDGTAVQRTGTGFDYNGQWFSVGYYTNDQGQSPWTAGNTYTQTVGLAGVQAQVPVTITANEIQSVVFKTVNMAENHNGEWREGTNPETGVNEQYYKYNWLSFMEYTVTMADGSTVQGTGTSFEYDGNVYQFYAVDDQSVTKQLLVGNTYAFDVKLGSKVLEVLVSVSSAMEADGYVYSVLDGAAVIADCTREDTVLTIPEKLGEYTVTGILTLGQALDWAEEIVVPDSVTMTGHDAFTGFMKPLKKLTLGSGISDIRLSQHYFSWNLEHIEVSKDNPWYTSVDGVVYDKDVTTMIVYPANKEDTHIIPDSVENIDILFNNTEYGYDYGLPPIYEGVSIRTGAGLKDFVTVDGIVYSADMTKIYTCEREVSGTYVMPESVTEVVRYAFANSSLEDVTWSSKVTEIVYGAFCYNDNLKTIRIPSSVKAIGLHAFGDSYGMESVYIEDLAGWCEIEFVDNPLRWGADLYVNEELVTDLQIPEGVEKIPNIAFMGVSATSLTLPETVHTIEYYAFKNSAIQKAVLSEGLRTIEGQAFYGSKLQSVTLPDSLTQMEWEAFANCTELESVHIGAGLSNIPSNAFSGAGLKSLVIPENIQSIGWSAFEYNPLQEVVFENDNVEIYDYAFLGCPLKEVNLPAAITQIADSAFARNKAVTISVPDSVTEIMYDSFAFSENLLSVVLPENIKDINTYAFQGSTRLSHVLYKGSAAQWDALAADSEELNNAALHLNALGNEVAVVDTCTRIWHYCYVCQQWEYVEKTGFTHSITDGVCTVCGYTEGAEETEPEVPETEYIPTEPETTEPVKEQSFDLTTLEKGTQYEEYTRDLGNGVTVNVVDGHIDGGIHLYHDADNNHHSKATFHSEKPIHGIHFRAGHMTGVLTIEVYQEVSVYQTRSVAAADDSGNWTAIGEVTITDAEYTDYAVDFGGESYSAVRLSSTGGTTIQLQTVTMEYAAEEPEVTEPESTEPSVPTEPSEPESSEPEVSEPETVDPETCTHSYGDWVITKAPTFSTSGRQQKTCEHCGKVVTQAIMPAVATVEKWNISLVDNLRVNFHLLISQSIESTAKVKISLADDTVTYNVKDLELTEEGLYVVSVDLAATQMADDIVVFIMDKNQMGCYANYTVRQYADTVLADESLSAYHDIVKEMLNYGAAAQNYFDYGADAPANEGITGAGMAEIPEQAGAPLSVTGSAEGVSFYAASLIYREQIAVRFYFKFSGDINACTFAANGEKLIPGLKDGLYYVDVTGITPEMLDQQVELTVTDEAGSVLTVSYSPMNYIVRMNAKGGQSLKALLKALYNYHLAAKAFYGKDDSEFKALDSGVWKSQSVVDGRLYDVTIDFRTQNNSAPHCGIGYGDDVTDNLQYWLDGGVTLTEIDGRYYYCGSGDGGSITYTTNGNTVSVDCESYIWITLERIGTDQLMVTSSEGSPLPVGVLLTWSEQ